MNSLFEFAISQNQHKEMDHDSSYREHAKRRSMATIASCKIRPMQNNKSRLYFYRRNKR